MDRLTHTEYQVIATYMCFLILFGGFVQIVTLLVLIRSKDLKTKSLTPYLINVVAANMVMVLGSFPSTLVSAIAKGWAFNDLVCRLVGFLGGIAAVAMIVTMACITVKIYTTVTARALTKHFKEDMRFTHYKVIFMVWLYSTIALIPPLVGWTNMVIESGYLNCAPNWNPEGIPDLVYILFLTILAYIFPVGLASIYHWRINRAIRDHLKTVSRFSSAQRQLEGFRNISKMAGLAIAAFTITWLPYCVYVVVCAFGGSHLIDVRTELIAALVAKSSILYSPFIYALVNPRFRANVMEFLRLKQLRSTAVSVLARSSFLSIADGNIEIASPIGPQNIIQNHPSLRSRGGRENTLIECEPSFPSFLEKQTVNGQPRVLIIRPVPEKEDRKTVKNGV